MKKQLIAALSAASFLLSGCYLPEKFAAKLDVNPDASYHFNYSGKTALVPVVMQITTSKKPLDARGEAQMKAEADTIAKAKDVKKANYIGNGRFQIEVDATRPAGSPMDLFGIFKVSTDRDGVMTISTPPITEEDKVKLAKLGLSIDGTLDVTLPKNAEVVSSNATSSPRFFGLFGTYSWKVGSVDVRPMMRVRIKK